MPTYATTTSLVTHMIGANFTTTSTMASECLDRAEARIDAVLARRYDLTQATFQTYTSTPPIVREWAILMGAGHVWQQLARGGAGKESMARGKSLIESVMEDLKALADFELHLVDTSGSIIADMSNSSGRVLCNTTSYVPTFDEGDELSWRVDPDKVDDINDSKD